MSRSQSLGLRSTRLGLLLIWIGSTVLAYFLFFQSAIAAGLLPRVIAFDFSGFAGFMALLLLATLELGILRWAVKTDADNLSLFYLYFAVTVITCTMTYFNAETIVNLLAWVSAHSHWILFGAAAAVFAGLAYCLGGGGSFINWLFALAAMTCLAGAAACLLAVLESPFLKGPLKSIVEKIPVVGTLGTTASLLTGTALFFHVIYIWNIARRFRDESIGESSRILLICLIVGTLVVAMAVRNISSHQARPALKVGETVYDTHQIMLISIGALTAGLLGIWYSRLVDRTRLLIDLSRRR